MNMNIATTITDPFTIEFVDPRLPKLTAAKTRRRCDNCSKRRRGCDKKDPCSGCRHLRIPCTYSNINGDQGTRVESLMDHIGDRPEKRQKQSTVDPGMCTRTSELENTKNSLSFLFFV